MRHSRRLKKIALAIGLLCTGTLAQAQVYELSFVDTLGATKVRKPTATWYNPASQLVVTTISGLDRMVKLELIKGTTVVETQTSPLITVANRIVASDASEFYGSSSALPRPLMATTRCVPPCSTSTAPPYRATTTRSTWTQLRQPPPRSFLKQRV